MTELLTSAQMRAIEATAIASGEVTGLELMERAGRGVVEAVFEEWPELKAGSFRAVVLCGPGGNGGDGFVVARLLKEWGGEVEVFLYGEVEKMPPDARVNYERWMGMGEVRPWNLDAFGQTSRIDLLVDAVFGIGLNRALPDPVAAAFRILTGEDCPPQKTHIRSRFRKCVAVDVPSGLQSESGVFLGGEKWTWLRTKLTVTFVMQKVGHHLARGSFHCGNLVTKPLGLRREEFLERGLHHEPADDRRVNLIDQCLFGKPTPFLKGELGKSTGWNKFDNGHALVLSGSVGQGGAARMAARGALRIGAGLVTLGVPPSAMIENAAQVNAVMLARVEDGAALAEVLADVRINALCLGPGLGVERAKLLLALVLGAEGRGGVEPHPTAGGVVGDDDAAGRSMVLDADALTALSEEPALFAMLHSGCVLTPHGGEFARLFPDIAAKLAAPALAGPAYSKVDATREAAARAGCVVLFKGADTVIADPSGRCSINSAAYERAAPWLATAGSGDVLAGFICGLLARGFGPMQAAETAAWLHVECARSFGPGLVAEDLPEELPKVFRALGV